jgi:hypothetical protein
MSVLDLNAIKEQLQTILEAANTTTASTDLSSGLETRVQKVLKLNPNLIPIQSTWFPFVTSYIDAKVIEEQTINAGQANGRRKAQVSVKVVGCVWNSTVSTEDNDEAADDCESLMENIEQILRSNLTLNSTVSWQLPTDCSYFDGMREGAHLRAGVLTLKCTAFY